MLRVCAQKSIQVRVSSSLTDEAVLRLIRRKLSGVSSVSYADIATTADSAGRRKLALLLLEHEPRVQVNFRKRCIPMSFNKHRSYLNPNVSIILQQSQVPGLLHIREHRVRMD